MAHFDMQMMAITGLLLVMMSMMVFIVKEVMYAAIGIFVVLIMVWGDDICSRSDRMSFYGNWFFPIKLLNFLLIVDYSAYFISGATFYLVWQNGLSRSRVAILILTLALSIYQSIHSLVYFEQKYNTTMNIFGVGAIITSFFIVMLLVSLKRTGLVGNKEWALAGALTYPIYLLHQNIGFMIFNISYRLMNPYILLCITLVIFFMAYMVNVFIEKRFSSHLKSLVTMTIDMLFHPKIK
jgi:hypothetical protein